MLQVEVGGNDSTQANANYSFAHVRRSHVDLRGRYGKVLLDHVYLPSCKSLS